MTGNNEGATTILRMKINHEILTFHCIIHQETLCKQTFPVEIVEVMNLVIRLIIASCQNHVTIITLNNS